MRSKTADEILEKIRKSENKEICVLGVKLRVNNKIYIPGGESELLAEHLLRGNFKIKPGEKVLDYGCGSGFLGIIAAKQSGEVVSIDLNKEAVKITKENALLNNVEIDARLSNGFENIGDNEKFDVILASLPYEDAEIRDELELSVYDPGFQMRKSLFENAKKHLNKSGRIFFTYSERAEKIAPVEIFKGFSYEIIDKRVIDKEEYYLYLIVAE